MDYKNNYLRYKQKYLALKNKSLQGGAAAAAAVPALLVGSISRQTFLDSLFKGVDVIIEKNHVLVSATFVEWLNENKKKVKVSINGQNWIIPVSYLRNDPSVNYVKAFQKYNDDLNFVYTWPIKGRKIPRLYFDETKTKWQNKYLKDSEDLDLEFKFMKGTWHWKHKYDDEFTPCFLDWQPRQGDTPAGLQLGL